MPKTNFARCLFWLGMFGLLFSACSRGIALPILQPNTENAPTDAGPVTVSPATVAPSLPPTLTPIPLTLWIAPAIPEGLRAAVEAFQLPAAVMAQSATVTLETNPKLPGANQTSLWLYALVAPFPTIADGVTFAQVQDAWAGNPPEVFGNKPLLMTASTYAALQTVFGGEAGAGGVQIINGDLTSALWTDRPQWGIAPFELLNPQLKVLEIDGQAPIRKDFDAQVYPLKVTFGLTCLVPCHLALPGSNRDPQKLATVLMTGVTALVRATAYKMEVNGVTYPAEDIRHWLTGADITHVSNEVPFAVGCPYPDRYQTRLIFCSDPKYIELLDYIGLDVVELTGNHFEDWGKESTFNTLEMYRARGLPYFGGGSDLADAQKPAILERGGMKFAFIGCNPAGPTFAWARDDGWPGAAPCGPNWPGKVEGGTGYEWIIDEIKQLKAEGYLVIATFQYFEYYSPEPRPWQQDDFRLLADAGAVIVSGSQGHYAQALEFYNGAFIHYGLGNLFFDQMGYTNPTNGLRTSNTRREFMDRFVFYDGRLISTELLTAMLEDWSRPRPMTPEERDEFLQEYFTVSGW